MAGFANYLEAKILDEVFGATSFVAPATLYIGLHVGGVAPDLELATGITEPSGGGYARVAVTNNKTNWSAAAVNGSSQMEVSNLTPITFAQASASWGTATHFIIYDAASAGNVLAIGDITVDKLISSGDTASFAASALKVTLD